MRRRESGHEVFEYSPEPTRAERVAALRKQMSQLESRRRTFERTYGARCAATLPSWQRAGEKRDRLASELARVLKQEGV